MSRARDFIIQKVIRPHKFWSFVLFMASVFWAFTLPLMSYFLGQVIESMKLLGSGNASAMRDVEIFIGLLLTFNILRNINYYIIGTGHAKIFPEVKTKTISSLFSYLCKQSYGYFESRQAGFITGKITSAVSSIEPIGVMLYYNLTGQLLLILSTGLFMATVSPAFSVIFWIWAITVIYLAYHNAKKGRIVSKAYAEANSHANGAIIDTITNIENVVQNEMSDYELQVSKKSIDDLLAKDITMQRYMNNIKFAQALLSSLYIVATTILLLYGFKNSWVTIGSFIFVLDMTMQTQSQVQTFGSSVLDFYKILGQIDQGMNLLDDPVDVVNAPAAKNIQIRGSAIKLEQVSFTYTDEKVIDNIDVDIQSGEKIGLVGYSGGGKTTLIKLLMRLYDIDAGQIMIDGHDIKDFTLKSLRNQIALVPQNLMLFHRSIRDNICYGMEGITEVQLREAAEHAHCAEFIDPLKDGYDTLVGERGIKLSGGQRQRIAIARAILKQAPILLLDEATSALDSKTEQKIQKSLEFLMRDKTAVVVAHRLSTLNSMDRILVMDQGKIVEQGTHEELLSKDGIFKSLWSQQTDGFI